jgi:acetyltransferase
MSVHNLDKIFQPASVAVVGASEKRGSIGHSLIRNLIGGNYQGKVYPVNPRYPSILGLTASPSLSAIGEPVDLAVIAVPMANVPSVIRECVRAKVGGSIIISAGGKEIGVQGKRVEAHILAEAGDSGLRIIGPNCMGIVSAGSSLNASFAALMPLSGKLAFISQSGAICSAILDLSIKEGIGFRHFVSIGSMLDVDFGDLISYLGNDPQVRSLVIYMENLTRTRKFMSAARAISRVKPIVVLKAGKSRAGARAASSHTGALTGEDQVYHAAFKRAGIVRVDTIGDLFDCAELMAKQPLPSGAGLAILTNGGGPGVMAADALSVHDLEPAALSPETMEKLDSCLPPFWSKGNPIDILGDASAKRWQRALEVCLSARDINALLIIFVPQGVTNAVTVAESVVSVIHAKPAPPLFAVWMGGENVERARQILNDSGVPTYETPERAVSAFLHLYTYSRNMQMLQQIPPKLPLPLEFHQEGAKTLVSRALEEDNTLLTEVESKALLRSYGIAVNRTEVAGTADEAVRLARDMGYPVVMKIHSPDISHKSDAQGVLLNLESDSDVREAFGSISTHALSHNPNARILGVTIQPMVRDADYELILGSKRDPDFGPVILFGLGGTMTEILKDQAIALPPLNRLLARRLMEGTKVYQMLKGFRNRPPARLELLEETLIRLSQLVTDLPEIEELDINPLLLAGGQAWAVDARVCLKASDIPSPQHLCISPYPNQYESRVTTEKGIEMFVRPVRPEDAPLLVELFHSLSPRSVYYRFFTPLKSLSPKMLAQLTQIDYDRDIALVGIDDSQPQERILGVARLMTRLSGTDPEFAVTVGDPWHRKGIGAALMKRLIHIARERGLPHMWGVVLAENTHMLALARKLGAKISKVSGANEYEVKIDLKELPRKG